MPETKTISLVGTENLQTQEIIVVASAAGGTTIELGVPPSGAAPRVTVVSPANGATISLINGALGIVSTSVVSGAAVSTIAAAGAATCQYAGGYWLIQ